MSAAVVYWPLLDGTDRVESSKKIRETRTGLVPSPLVGEGWGGGSGVPAAHPPPQPSPARGEGAGYATRNRLARRACSR